MSGSTLEILSRTSDCSRKHASSLLPEPSDGASDDDGDSGGLLGEPPLAAVCGRLSFWPPYQPHAASRLSLTSSVTTMPPQCACWLTVHAGTQALSLPMLEAREMLTTQCTGSMSWAEGSQQCLPPNMCKCDKDCVMPRCGDPSHSSCQYGKCTTPPPPKTTTAPPKPVSQATAQQACTNYATQNNNNLNTNNGDANSSESS